MVGLTPFDLAELRALCPGGVQQNVSLAELSQWRIGGKADLLLTPSSTEELINLRAWFFAQQKTHVLIGATSNLLFADEGLRVPCIQIGQGLSRIEIKGRKVYAEAGAWVPGLARSLMKHSLTGGEHICGIPGTLGGLVFMNGGSQRKGIGNSVQSIQSIDQAGNVVHRSVSECGFSYRHSVFQRNQEVITSVLLRFRQGNQTKIRHEMLNILAARRKKFPRKLPNCGSVFKSNPAMYADVGSPGEIIERLGLKKFRKGDVFVSPLHANFIVHDGQGSSKDILELIYEISAKVLMETGHQMESEVIYVNPNGKLMPADKASITLEH